MKYAKQGFNGHSEFTDGEKTVVFENTHEGTVEFCQVNGDWLITGYDCRKGSMDVFYHKDGSHVGIEKDCHQITGISISAGARSGEVVLSGALNAGLTPAVHCDIETARIAALKGDEKTLNRCNIAGRAVKWGNGRNG
ncbi:MAG: hypothetical protein FWF01_00620 [Alphaproteobacteria bacterium]|nr:hypothetical protein [Alphaproteobacteria bacterium]